MLDVAQKFWDNVWDEFPTDEERTEIENVGRLLKKYKEKGYSHDIAYQMAKREASFMAVHQGDNMTN